MKKYKLAILASHPIQYQTPLFKKITENSQIDLMVYFNWDFGVGEESFADEFGKKIKWDIPILEGYKYKFLKNFFLKPSDIFFGQINLGIIKELVINNYDAVVVFGWNSFTNWLVFLTKFIHRTRIILQSESPLNQELLKSKWKIKIKKIILGWLFKHISAFLYIGEENKKFYQFYDIPEEKLFFAPYAVDNDRFIKAGKSLMENRNDLRNKIGIAENDAVILFVGKMIEKKHPMDLLKAYELMISNQELVTSNQGKVKNANSHLIFVGDGILRAELERYVKENNLKNLHFAGFKNQTELPQYYALADIFVLPSGIGETWGLVVNEAMCFSLLVIVSDVVGCGQDLVRQNENGFVFLLGDINKLAERLKELAENKEKREQFGKKSFEIIQKYSYKKDIEGILKALKIAN